MGDFADAVLDGDICQICGEFMDDGNGFPQTCAGCKLSNIEVAEDGSID